MATSVTFFPPRTDTRPNSSLTNRTSYLARCVKDLSPDKVIACEKKSTQWKIASTVSTVAFFALAISAFITTSFLLPAHAPIAAITMLVLAAPAVQQIEKFRQRSREAQEQAETYKTIQRNYAHLNTQTSQQLQQILCQRGISSNTQDRNALLRLTPLLAKAQYYEKETLKWMNFRDKHANKARTLPITTPSGKDNKRLTQCLALTGEELAMAYKIRNAFIHAVLRNPEFKGTLKDLGSFSDNNYQHRAFGNALNDPTSNQLFLFNRNFPPLTLNDVKTMTVADLSHRISVAMTS